MTIKRPNLKFNKPTAIIFLLVVAIFVVIAIYGLRRSAEKHDRKFMPTKNGLESKE
jgi:hypothetical protein